MPISVDWVIETTLGCEVWGSPMRIQSGAINSGVNFPSLVGISNNLTPNNLSGAPPSSTFI